MRWIWIDRILELEKSRRCVSMKNVSMAEDVLHDHFPATATRPAIPVVPNPLIIEGMAQTAGILVGHANDFREKVVLAKINKAEFHDAAWPGYAIRYTAEIERIDVSGASTTGTVHRIDPADPSAEPIEIATINLMFSHLDHNAAGLAFPEENFVFSAQLQELITRSGLAV